MILPSFKKSINLLLLCAILLTAPFVPMKAEEVLLKNGSVVSGKISKMTFDDIFIDTDKGSVSIRKSNIIKVQYVPFTAKQKAKALEAKRKKIDGMDLEKVKLQQIEEAQAKALRASALRELVAKGQMEKPQDEPISYWDFAWRSMVLPGWGHFYLERPWFGIAYSGGTAILLAAVINTRSEALSAQRENHRDAELNFLISSQPDMFTKDLRVTYGVYANARGITDYQNKIDQYHGALAALATLYCVQLVHIIYNGFAWENGLLIVENQKKDHEKLKTNIYFAPDYTGEGKMSGLSLHGGLTIVF